MSFVSVSSTTPGSCACCGLGTVALYCRTRGGTASLIGCAEMVTPSSPPKRYRRAETAGSATILGWVLANCPGSADVTTICDYGNWQQYAADGTFSHGGVTTCTATPPNTDPPGCLTATDFNNNCANSWSVNNTVAARSTTGVCCEPAANWIRVSSDTLTYTLSDEDTEEDAIARLLATGPGGTWSAWVLTGDGSGSTCLPASCCQANYQQRVSSISFGYQESQFKADITALAALTAYVVNFQIYRRLYGSTDPWVLFVESPFGFTTDASGNYSITAQDVPNLEGYETYVCCPFIYTP